MKAGGSDPSSIRFKLAATGGPTAPDQMHSTWPAPEVIGVMLAVIVYAVVGIAILVAGPVTREVPTPSPANNAVVATPRPAATLNASLVLSIRNTNARIVALGGELERLLAEDPFVTSAVAMRIREISAAATFAKGVVDRIQFQPGGAAIAPVLRASYDVIVIAADKALSVAFTDRVAVRQGADGVLIVLVDLPDIDKLLAAAAAGASPSLPSEPGASPTETTAGTPGPNPTPRPTATPSPTPSPNPSSQLVNGSFETGLDPWRLVLASGAAGTFERTTVDPYSGHASAVVTVTGGAGPWSALSVEQGGLTLESGVTYRVSLAVRSTAAREIRIRLSTALGEVIASRVLPVTATWTTVSFQVTPIGRFQDVTLQIEAGASGQRIWMDDVSLG